MEDFEKFEFEVGRWFMRAVAFIGLFLGIMFTFWAHGAPSKPIDADMEVKVPGLVCPSCAIGIKSCLLYASPRQRDQRGYRIPSSA